MRGHTLGVLEDLSGRIIATETGLSTVKQQVPGESDRVPGDAPTQRLARGQETRFERDGLVITVSKSTNQALVVWEGVSDAREPGHFLNDILQQLASELVALEVAVDLRPLAFVNSATVSPIFNLIRLLDQSNSLVEVVFSTADWQRTHYQCLLTLARTLRNVRVKRAPCA